jgi:predicted transcriptional regulator
MMLTKKQVLEAIEAMPEEKFTHINVIIEELILLDKIEKGLEDLQQGQILSEEAVNKEIDKW